MEQLLKPLADIFGTVTANGLAPITAATCVFVLLFDVCRRKALSTEKVGFKSSLPSLYVSIAAIALLQNASALIEGVATLEHALDTFAEHLLLI